MSDEGQGRSDPIDHAQDTVAPQWIDKSRYFLVDAIIKTM